MKRFYVFKDGRQQGSTATRDQALYMIHQYQKLEAHPFLKSEFSLIEGEEEFIPYPNQRKQTERGRKLERQ